MAFCEMHEIDGQQVPATTRSTNPDWSGYAVCEDCAADLNARERIYAEAE